MEAQIREIGFGLFYYMDEQKLEILTHCAKDLLYFGKQIVPKMFYLPTPKFHEEIAELLMDRSKPQVCIQAPRGFAKSTMAILFCLHHAIFDEGDKLIIIQSKTRAEAINRISTIKNILEYGSAYKRLFGYSGMEVAQTWREDKIKTTIGKYTVTMKAIGTGMPARGGLEGGFTESEGGDIDIDVTRITLYFLEDPDDEDNTLTDVQMDKNWSKFLGNIQGMDKRLNRVLAIGTPVAKGCIVDKISSNPIGWESRVYRAEWDEDGEKKYLWEEMRDAQWLANKREELKASGKLSKYYSEYLCQLKKGEDVFFKGYHTYKGFLFWQDGYAYLKISRIDGIDLPETKVVPVNTFLGIDPASSTEPGACYSVTFSSAYSSDEDFYTLPYFRQRVPPLTHAEQIIESIRLNKYTYGSVETVNYQLFLKDFLLKRMNEENLYVMGLQRKWNPHEKKDSRLETMQPMFATGHVYILEDQTELIDEMEMFPDGTKDLLDGMYYSSRKLYKPDHTVKTAQEQEDDLKYFLMSKPQISWMSN